MKEKRKTRAARTENGKGGGRLWLSFLRAAAFTLLLLLGCHLPDGGSRPLRFSRGGRVAVFRRRRVRLLFGAVLPGEAAFRRAGGLLRFFPARADPFPLFFPLLGEGARGVRRVYPPLPSFRPALFPQTGKEADPPQILTDVQIKGSNRYEMDVPE